MTDQTWVSNDARPRRVAVFDFNPFTHDSRVLNEARSLAQEGIEVVVVAVEVGAVPPVSSPGVRVIRLPFDPIYRRLWDARASFLRPWRHGREIAAMARRRNGFEIAALVVLGIPWVLAAAGYYAMARIAGRIRGLAGRRPTRRRGAWLEQRYKDLLFLAPDAVRVATWSREVVRAYANGSIPVSDVWTANDLQTLPVALLLRRRYGGHVVYENREIYLEMRGPLAMGPARRALLAAAERYMARSADAVITVNDAIAEELRRRWHVPRPIVLRSVPPLWSPPDDFVSPLRPALAAAGIDPKRRMFLYHGNLEPGRGIERLVTAVRELDDVALVFLGRGTLHASLDTAAATGEWSGRLAVLPVVDPDDLLPWVAGADVSACLIEPTSLNNRLASPNKLFQAIAAGVPVLGSDFGPIREDIERYGVGATADATDPVAIRLALRRLLDLPDAEFDALRVNARRAHVEELNWEREAARLLAVYERLAPARSGQAAAVGG
jgi:glycosyltransferase involved in cell wall biosynthesis